MNHYIKKCKECQTVMGQCRCFAENKFVEWGVCEKCSAPNRVRDSKARLILTYGGEGYISLDEVEAELDALIAAVREQEQERCSRLRARDAEIRSAAVRTERVEVTEAMVEKQAKRIARRCGYHWRTISPMDRTDFLDMARGDLTAALEEL